MHDNEASAFFLYFAYFLFGSRSFFYRTVQNVVSFGVIFTFSFIIMSVRRNVSDVSSIDEVIQIII